MFKNINENNRQLWLERILGNISNGKRILDAGAGELKNKKHCNHLEYLSQDFAQYEGSSDNSAMEGLHPISFNASGVDIISDIVTIPQSNESFDAILCSEVLEHIPDPLAALDEFDRLLKPGGLLILTAPFSSIVHFAPFHFCTGFSKFWYEHHLTKRNFVILQLIRNGDWYALLRQEISRLGSLERKNGNWTWPLAYLSIIFSLCYLFIRPKKDDNGLACFGWHCLAKKL